MFAFVLAAIPVYVDFDKALKWVSSLDVESIDEPVEGKSGIMAEFISEVSTESQSQAQPQNLTDFEGLVTESLILPPLMGEKESKAEPELLASDVTAENLFLGSDDQSSDRKSRGSTGVALNSLDDSTSQKIELELGANSAGIEDTSSNAVSPLVNPWFVQHASFRAPQRAFLWKQNQRLDKELKVFSKGETNARFVVVSGPFDSRELAQSYLNSNNMGNDKFFVPSDKLGERIYP